MTELTVKLADIQTKLKAKKSSYNSFGKYNFRKAEDILEAIKPFLLEHKVYVVTTEEIIGTEPVPMIKTTATISDGTSAIHATAIVGVDLNQKGMQTSQQFGAASTYGKKYALGNLLLIDDTEDADASNTHGKTTAKTLAAKKSKMNKEQFGKAKMFIVAGGDIKSIEAKYEVSAAQIAELKQIVKDRSLK